MSSGLGIQGRYLTTGTTEYLLKPVVMKGLCIHSHQLSGTVSVAYYYHYLELLLTREQCKNTSNEGHHYA
jgi:hypothetical protein